MLRAGYAKIHFCTPTLFIYNCNFKSFLIKLTAEDIRTRKHVHVTVNYLEFYLKMYPDHEVNNEPLIKAGCPVPK